MLFGLLKAAEHLQQTIVAGHFSVQQDLFLHRVEKDRPRGI